MQVDKYTFDKIDTFKHHLIRFNNELIFPVKKL
jgi:hypothetical protein